MSEAKIGVIGGSGLYSIEGLHDTSEVSVETPFGPPSDSYLLGILNDVPVVFLARHGKNHKLLPSEINFRANIWGFKKLGVERIISASAVGSLKLDHKPLEIVFPDQFFDRTRGRISTFFGKGVVAHVSFADPTCSQMLQVLQESANRAGVVAKTGGTYLCMEGPAFSTRAESNVYRSWGMDVIGMTNLQEAKLAREAEICYATMALITDYDCWHLEEESVTVEMLLGNLHKNVENAKRIIREAVRPISALPPCQCQDALKTAIFTDLKLVPQNN
jgi:5'-methylthioadenosine phosphorylase